MPFANSLNCNFTISARSVIASMMLERQIERSHRENEASQRLMAIPGVRIMTATAMVATVGDARQFRNSRDLAAWVILTPRKHSTGSKPKMLGISKRGDVYPANLAQND